MNRKDVPGLAGSVCLGALAGFALLTMVVIGRDGAPLFMDSGLHTWSDSHRPTVALAVARGLTATGTGVWPYALVVLAGVIAGRTARQRVIAAAMGLGCLLAGQGLRYGVLHLVARPRPPEQDWATHASGWSFPSGHTSTSAITALLLIIAVLLRSPRGRRTTAVVIGCWAVAVGLTRVYLGVHWFTDVLGGWLYALAWVGLVVGVGTRWWERREERGRRVPVPVQGAGRQGPGAVGRTSGGPGSGVVRAGTGHAGRPRRFVGGLRLGGERVL
ncbi:phosphatase PAP2 family protein [Streptomyces sp. NPDC091292]|uniref:phosphatase PAP2 family protein n=1 Tax=Streptomyces sp. NPDC091292 TaxID=3365991 RepID=UPI003810EB4F